MIPNNPQHAVWYSLPNVWGLCGQNTHPGRVHWLNQIDINSLRHKAHAALKIVRMCSLHVEIKSWICQNLSRNNGDWLRVNRNAEVIAKKCRRNMYRLKVNDGMSLALSSDSLPVLVAVFLVDCNSGGRRFSRSHILPKLIKRPLLFHLNPSLHSVEEARDSAAPKKNGDKPLPPTGCHITANGDEIIDMPARFGVDKGRGNVLWWLDEFYKARTVWSLAETQPCARCHRQMKIVTRSS